MTGLAVTSRVGDDGILHLELPLGASEAGREVRVTVEPIKPPMTQEERRAFIARTAGSWQGEFERPPQGEYEVREPLS